MAGKFKANTSGAGLTSLSQITGSLPSGKAFDFLARAGTKLITGEVVLSLPSEEADAIEARKWEGGTGGNVKLLTET
jgi:hypothetical protein